MLLSVVYHIHPSTTHIDTILLTQAAYLTSIYLSIVCDGIGRNVRSLLNNTCLSAHATSNH